MLAEEEGFEPPERSHAQRFSRPPHSTTLPLLRGRATVSAIIRGNAIGRLNLNSAPIRHKVKTVLPAWLKLMVVIHSMSIVIW